MSHLSRASVTPQDLGIAVQHSGSLDDTTVDFVTIRQDHSLAPLLKGLPDDRCQCPHWGYLFSGQLTVEYADRTEVIEAGEAFYMPPGHAPAATAGSEFVQFSPTAELAVTLAAIERNAAAMA